MEHTILDDDLRKAYIQAATIVAKYSDKYLPLFKRLEAEFNKRKEETEAMNNDSMNNAFGLIVIGDELLLGTREDKHFAYFRQMLGQRDQRLHHCWLLPDDETSLITHLTLSMREALPVFVCGGIGATPDDLTRGCAAVAAGVTLEHHPEAVALIEERFGEQAYPTRIQMAVLP
jgi:hypothetical protein